MRATCSHMLTMSQYQYCSLVLTKTSLENSLKSYRDSHPLPLSASHNGSGWFANTCVKKDPPLTVNLTLVSHKHTHTQTHTHTDTDTHTHTHLIRMDYFSDPLGTESLEPTTRPEYRCKSVLFDDVCESHRWIVRIWYKHGTMYKIQQPKHNPITWQEQHAKNHIERSMLISHVEIWSSVLTIRQIAKTVQEVHRPNRIESTMPVSQPSRLLRPGNKTKQVRRADQALYPIQSGSFGWTWFLIVCHVPPAYIRSFTSFQMVHVHTHTHTHTHTRTRTRTSTHAHPHTDKKGSL